jgi:hypothetical protein
MSKSIDAGAFPPFPFSSRAVPETTQTFDFERWKREPSGPIVLKGALADWPLFQTLRKCGSDDERLDYLSAKFGDSPVGYTTVPARDPFMGYDENGKQNFKYAPSSCTLSDFCALMRAALRNPDSDILYARGGANSVRTWKGFPQTVRPLDFLRGMTPNGEGIWLGSGRHISYMHQDAHFNFLLMVAGVKRALLYPLEAIADLYPTPFYGGIAGTTSSFVKPRAPDYRRFPRFANAAKQAWVAMIEGGDVLCLPPCWWHHIEAAPGLNLMINTFVWALPPVKERQFEVLVRDSIKTALGFSKEELSRARSHLYQESSGEAAQSSLSPRARELSQELSRFLQPDIPGYWQRIAKCYYDHYIFQLNGHPVSTYPERHANWVKAETSLKQRFRSWLRFNRDLLQMRWRRKRAEGIVP